jgi:hypothetical protein
MAENTPQEAFMVLQYLGTAAAEGWPGLFCACEHCEIARTRGGRNIRTRSQAIVFAEKSGEGDPDQRLLVDFPPDTYHHVLAHGLRLDKVGHLIICCPPICNTGAIGTPPRCPPSRSIYMVTTK